MRVLGIGRFRPRDASALTCIDHRSHPHLVLASPPTLLSTLVITRSKSIPKHTSRPAHRAPPRRCRRSGSPQSVQDPSPGFGQKEESNQTIHAILVPHSSPFPFACLSPQDSQPCRWSHAGPLRSAPSHLILLERSPRASHTPAVVRLTNADSAPPSHSIACPWVSGRVVVLLFLTILIFPNSLVDY